MHSPGSNSTASFDTPRAQSVSSGTTVLAPKMFDGVETRPSSNGSSVISPGTPFAPSSAANAGGVTVSPSSEPGAEPVGSATETQTQSSRADTSIRWRSDTRQSDRPPSATTGSAFFRSGGRLGTAASIASTQSAISRGLPAASSVRSASRPGTASYVHISSAALGGSDASRSEAALSNASVSDTAAAWSTYTLDPEKINRDYKLNQTFGVVWVPCRLERDAVPQNEYGAEL